MSLGWKLIGWFGVVLIAFGVAQVAAADSVWYRLMVYVSMLAIYCVGRLHGWMERG